MYVKFLSQIIKILADNLLKKFMQEMLKNLRI